MFWTTGLHLFILFRRRHLAIVRRRWFYDLLEALAPDSSYFKSHLKFVVLLLGFMALIFALVNPKMGTELETVKREGVDLVFAVDVSKSMLAEDIAPNRLEKAKRLVSETINKLSGDRVGIIAYAASAIPQLPITTDYESAKLFLQALNTDMLSSQGTAIAEAIDLSKPILTMRTKPIGFGDSQRRGGS